MADIKLVISISEDSYKATCNGYMLPLDVENVVQGIKNGIPLPKGHGNLVDYEELKHNAREYGAYVEATLSHVKPKTIIEADEGQTDGNDD